MGSNSSKNDEIEIDQIDIDMQQYNFATIFFNIFINRTDVITITKIDTVSDFGNLCKFIEGSKSKTLQNLYGTYDHKPMNIGKKTKNIIYFIRKMMIERQKNIINNLDEIEYFNEVENSKKIANLRKLLIIEHSKMSNFLKLSRELCSLMQKQSKFENREILKNNFLNISLFLECTNHLILEIPLKIPHATQIFENSYPSAPCEIIPK